MKTTPIDVIDLKVTFLPLLGSVILLLASEYAIIPRKLRFFLKPLSSLLIFALAWQKTQSWPLLTALVFAFMGDCFLMIPTHFLAKIAKKSPFFWGLLSFLLMHLFYIFGLIQNIDLKFDFIVITYDLFLVLVGVFYFLFLKKHLGHYKIAVLLYSVFLLGFGILTAFGPLGLALGAFLFILSDFTLAYKKFIFEHRLAQLLVLTTYYFAQYLIVSHF